MADITQLLAEIKTGDAQALEELFQVVHSELRQLAHGKLARERSGHTLQTTALIDDAFMRLVGQDSLDWESRKHFFRCAAEAMRRILIDHARRKQRKKRGGLAREDLELHQPVTPATAEEILAVDDSIDQLDPKLADVFKLRYFAGLTVPEIAAALQIGERTVDKRWAQAKAWLRAKWDQ